MKPSQQILPTLEFSTLFFTEISLPQEIDQDILSQLSKMEKYFQKPS